MTYSRMDWNPPARGVAGGGCKISPAVIFTNNNNNNKKQNEVSLCTYTHAIDTQAGLEFPPTRWGAGELNTPVLLLFLILIV